MEAKTPHWIQILIAVLIITSLVGWSGYSAQRDIIKDYHQQVEDLKLQNSQLNEKIDDTNSYNSLLRDDLAALGYRPVDLPKTVQTSRSVSLNDIVGDSTFWNKSQDVLAFMDVELSGHSIAYNSFGEWNVGGEWNDIDLTKDYWQMLKDRGINSIIAVGNLDIHGETLSESNHSWILVFYKDWGNDGWSKTAPLLALIFEPTKQESFVIHVPPLPLESETQYGEGYFYSSPLDLEADINGGG
jgi:hypothetical protein